MRGGLTVLAAESIAVAVLLGMARVLAAVALGLV